MCLCVYPSVRPSVRPSIHPSIHPSRRLPSGRLLSSARAPAPPAARRPPGPPLDARALRTTPAKHPNSNIWKYRNVLNKTSVYLSLSLYIYIYICIDICIYNIYIYIHTYIHAYYYIYIYI